MVEIVLNNNKGLQDYVGRYLTFFLGDEEYGLEIKYVKEIIRVMQITVVPRSDDYILGVINLRGKVVPVIDLRLKFCLPESARTEKSCIIVVEYGNEFVGVLVDAVSEVIDIEKNDFDETAFLDQNVDEQYICGIGKVNGKIKILINVKNILAYNDDDII